MEKTNQKQLSIVKVIKKKGDKLHFKWKGYDNSFNNWIVGLIKRHNAYE